MKERCDGEWYRDSMGGVSYVEPGFYEVGAELPKPAIAIGRRAYVQLLDFVKEHERDVVRTSLPVTASPGHLRHDSAKRQNNRPRGTDQPLGSQGCLQQIIDFLQQLKEASVQ